MSIESVMPSNHLILCHPLLLLPSIFPSIRGFSNESVLRIRWPKYWSFSFSISPSNEYSGLISFRMDWLDLLAVQGILKSLLNTTVQMQQFFMSDLKIHLYLRFSEKQFSSTKTSLIKLLIKAKWFHSYSPSYVLRSEWVSHNPLFTVGVQEKRVGKKLSWPKKQRIQLNLLINILTTSFLGNKKGKSARIRGLTYEMLIWYTRFVYSLCI